MSTSACSSSGTSFDSDPDSFGDEGDNAWYEMFHLEVYRPMSARYFCRAVLLRTSFPSTESERQGPEHEEEKLEIRQWR